MTSLAAGRLRHRLRRLRDRMLRPVFALAGRDPTTGASVRPRADLVRLGSRHGGWVIPAGQFDAGSICYCAGCGEDITFDLALIARWGCTVHAFDPTPRAIAHVARAAAGEDRYRFTPVGLWDRPGELRFYAPQDATHVSHSALNLQRTRTWFEGKVDRLSRLMAARGHARLDLLKLDIEGAEYRVLDSLLDDGVRIGVLCVEYDECGNPLDHGYRERIRGSVARLLAAGYALVAAEPGGNCTFVHAGAAPAGPQAGRPWA